MELAHHLAMECTKPILKMADLDEGIYKVKTEDFEVNISRYCVQIENKGYTSTAYKFEGSIYFLISVGKERRGMIIGRSHLELLHSRLVSLHNLLALSPVYPASNTKDLQPVDISSATSQILDKFSSEMLRSYPCEALFVAKRMKAARAVLENSFHSHEDTQLFDTDTDSCHAVLLKDLLDISPVGVDWFNFFCSLRVTDRILMDLSYIFTSLLMKTRTPLSLQHRLPAR